MFDQKMKRSQQTGTEKRTEKLRTNKRENVVKVYQLVWIAKPAQWKDIFIIKFRYNSHSRQAQNFRLL